MQLITLVDVSWIFSLTSTLSFNQNIWLWSGPKSRHNSWSEFARSLHSILKRDCLTRWFALLMMAIDLALVSVAAGFTIFPWSTQQTETYSNVDYSIHVHRVPECLSLRRNWVPPPPQASVGQLDRKPGSLYTLCIQIYFVAIISLIHLVRQFFQATSLVTLLISSRNLSSFHATFLHPTTDEQEPVSWLLPPPPHPFCPTCPPRDCSSSDTCPFLHFRSRGCWSGTFPSLHFRSRGCLSSGTFPSLHFPPITPLHPRRRQPDGISSRFPDRHWVPEASQARSL